MLLLSSSKVRGQASRSTKSRLRSVAKLLGPRDAELIRHSWAAIAARGRPYQERLIARTWLRASAYSPEWVWEALAGVRERDSDEEAEANPRFRLPCRPPPASSCPGCLTREVEWRHIVSGVLAFLDNIILTAEMDLEVLTRECADLGRRHFYYFKFTTLSFLVPSNPFPRLDCRQGFQTSYWDSFSVSMVEGIETALFQEVPSYSPTG